MNLDRTRMPTGDHQNPTRSSLSYGTAVVSERIGLALDHCHSIHVWSRSPRTDVLGHSQPSLRDWSCWITPPRTDVLGYSQPSLRDLIWRDRFSRIHQSPHSLRLSAVWRSRGRPLLHHHRSATAWLIAIQQKGQRHHQDRSKAKHIIDVHISQGLGLRVKVVVQLALGQV